VEHPRLLGSQTANSVSDGQHLGRLRVEADPFAGLGTQNFARNLTELRFEVKCLMAVRHADAARRIAAT
jgi:hypothetical protein